MATMQRRKLFIGDSLAAAVAEHDPLLRGGFLDQLERFVDLLDL